MVLASEWPGTWEAACTIDGKKAATCNTRCQFYANGARLCRLRTRSLSRSSLGSNEPQLLVVSAAGPAAAAYISASHAIAIRAAATCAAAIRAAAIRAAATTHAERGRHAAPISPVVKHTCQPALRIIPVEHPADFRSQR